MDLKLSLTAKVVILCAVPLLFQLGLLGALEYLRNAAEESADRATRSKSIKSEINKLAVDVFKFEKEFGGESAVLEKRIDQVSIDVAEQSTTQDYAKLKMLTADDAKQARTVSESQGNAIAALNDVRQLKREFEQSADTFKKRDDLWVVLREHASQIISPDLIKLGDDQDMVAATSSEQQREFRTQIKVLTFSGAGVSLILTLISALLLTRGVTHRLNRIIDNSVLLAGGRQLNPVIEGSDEIASLDKTFHFMADVVTDAARKERAIVHNSQDCILSIDAAGNLANVNPACIAMFGYSEDDLLGRKFMELVDRTSLSDANEFVERLKSGEQQKPLELTMKTRDGKTLEALWSAQWSSEERALFCVIRDQSEMKQAERLKQDVTAMITHDLRSPLTVVQNFLEFLNDGMYGAISEKGAKYLSGSRRNCDRMLSLVNDLLDVERFKAGMMKFDPQPVDLGAVVQQAQELLGAFADDRGVKLVCDERSVMVNAEEDLLNRLIANLVTNALKFAPSGSAVIVTVTLHGDMARLTVKDRGPGIPKDQLVSIFDRFHQVSDKVSNKGGSGLGLTICKLIVELHKGRIWAESEIGDGTAFIVALPALSKRQVEKASIPVVIEP